MKKINFRLSTILAAFGAAVVIASCASSSERGEFSFETLNDEKRELLFPEKGTESPSLTIKLSLAVPEDATISNLCRDYIYESMSAREYANALFKRNVEHYRALKTDISEEQEKELITASTSTWDYTEVVERLPAAALPTLVRKREYYTGGAHGNRESRYFVFNEKTKEQVMLDALILPESRDRLNALVTEAIRKRDGILPDRTLSSRGYFFDQIEANENFWITENGIGFHFDPYEIAPYVMGSIEISIRGSDAHELVTETYRKLLK